MRSKIGGDQVDILEQEQREFFVIGIGLRFFLPDRDRPVALLGRNSFVIPVSSFDEADRERPIIFARPSDQIAEISFAIAEVGLQGDADGGLRRELGFLKNGFEELQREILQLVALHIKIDKRTDGRRPAQNWAQTLLQRRDGIFRVSRMHIRCERRDFNGEIEARERTLRPDIAEAGRGFLREIFRDGIKDLKVALEESVGLSLVDDRLAEQIDRGGEARFTIFLDLLEEILAAFPGDELAGHVDDLRLDGRGDEGGSKRGCGEPDLQRGIEGDRLVAEIFLKMTNYFRGAIQGRQDIDEAKELRFKSRILHRPLHEAGVSAFFRKQRGQGLLVHEGEELFAFGADRRFEG